MSELKAIRERHELYIPYKAADPSNHVLTQLLTALSLMHKDRGELLKMVGELEAQLGKCMASREKLKAKLKKEQELIEQLLEQKP